jgi:hypothetical protein
MVWISHPLGYYGLLAVGLVLCLYLFISLKKENALLRQRLERQSQDSQDTFVEFRAALGSLSQSLQEHERDAEQMVPLRVSPSASINLTKRSQALRMYRRGETAEQICAALQMPRNEVELLLKVQKALAEQRG